MSSFASVQKTGYFFYSLIAIVLAYLIYEFMFIPHEVIAADEFVFLRHIADYTHALPYLDFSPYKTVLGYYLLTIPLFFAHGVLEPIFYIKDEITIINVLCMLLACQLVSQQFDKRAILLSILAIMANQFFLIYSTELRVNMLAAWCCLFAVLYLLQQRYFYSGLIIALALLISPTSFATYLAINCALLCCHFFRRSSFYSLRSLVIFNIGASIIIAAYIICWSMIASPSIVIQNIFSPYLQTTFDIYRSAYNILWLAILKHSPLLFLIWPLYPMAFLPQKNTIDEKRWFMFFFINIYLILFVRFFDPLPFNFVFTLPAFFLMVNDFFSWLWSQKTTVAWIKPSTTLTVLICIYSLLLLIVINIFSYDIIYNLIMLLPLAMLGLLHQQRDTQSLSANLILMIFIVTGIIAPGYQAITKSAYLNGDYQQANINLSFQLLNQQEDYVAGVPFFYQKDQPIAGLINLTDAQQVYISSPFLQVKSLLNYYPYLSPVSADDILEDFKHKPIKLWINNIRFFGSPLTTYILNNFKHYYGSIFLYAPTIFGNQPQFKLNLTGYYRVEADNNKIIQIDGKKIHSGEIVFLKTGEHLNKTPFAYRLVIQVKTKTELLNSKFQTENMYYILKPLNFS